MSSLLTRNYLQSRFWLAGLAISLTLTLAIIIGWQALSSFTANTRIAHAFSHLAQTATQFDNELAWTSASRETPNQNAQLKELHYQLLQQFALLRLIDGQKDGALEARWDNLQDEAALRPDVLQQQLRMSVDSMPDPILELWEKGAGNGSLEDMLGEYIALGGTLLQTQNNSQAQAAPAIEDLRALAQQLRPQLYAALRISRESSSGSGQNGLILLIICAATAILVTLAAILFVFQPLQRSVLETQQALIVERDRALSSDKVKREFLALMSHELRTPLNGILGFANMLLSSGLSVKQRDHAETIQTCGLTLLDLLNDILDISNCETGSLELEKVNFSLEDVTAEVVSLLAPQAFAKNLDLSAFIDPALPERMAGDVSRVRQILLNLVSNAIKFTDQGAIAIEVKHAKLHENGDHDIVISVADTGIGVKADQLDRIFEHFVQADSSTRRKHEGAGLGLPICKELAKLMDGDIGVSSTVGQGSTFWIQIRLAETNPAAAKIYERFKLSLTDNRFLIVHQNPLSRRIIRLQLEAFGAQADGIADKETALAMLAEGERLGSEYHAVIIDHMTPLVDGFALRKTIREDERFAQLKLIISCFGGVAFDQQARALGFDATCPKPIIQGKFLSQIKELLHGPASAPIVDESVTATFPPAAAQEPESKWPAIPRLLIAEDNPINQRLLMIGLQDAGYIVDVAGDGVEVIHALQNLPYDLILMDIRMPVMTGLEAAKRIRSMPGAISEIPIIAMTSNIAVDDRETYMAAGMTDYCTKPIDLPYLLTIVEQHVGKVEAASTKPVEGSAPGAESQRKTG